MLRTELLVGCALLVCGGCDFPKKASEPVSIGSVAEAPKHYEETRLQFSGTPKPEFIGVTSWRPPKTGRSPGSATNRPKFMYVVPVVPEGWTKDQPVPLWLTSSEELREDPSPWTGKLPALASAPIAGKVMDYADREPGMRTTSGWQKAVVDAEQKHGIESDPHAPIVMWPDP